MNKCLAVADERPTTFSSAIADNLANSNGDIIKLDDFTFEHYKMPIIKSVLPSLVADKIVNVQPMTSPVGGIAFYRPRYANKPKKTPLQELTERVWAEDEDTDADASECST